MFWQNNKAIMFLNEHGNQTKSHTISAIRAQLGWRLSLGGNNIGEYTLVKCIY